MDDRLAPGERACLAVAHLGRGTLDGHLHVPVREVDAEAVRMAVARLRLARLQGSTFAPPPLFPIAVCACGAVARANAGTPARDDSSRGGEAAPTSGLRCPDLGVFPCPAS